MSLKFPLFPSMPAAPLPERLHAHSDRIDGPYEKNQYDRPRIVPKEQANLISSATQEFGTHMPALDLDVPARLIPSSTPGHSHLYIDVPVTWEQYKTLLYALRDAGILEWGFVDASISKGATFLRKPGVTKQPRFLRGDQVRVVGGVGHTYTVADSEDADMIKVIFEPSGLTYNFFREELEHVHD